MKEDKLGRKKMTAKCPVCPHVLVIGSIPRHLCSKHPQAYNEYLKKKEDGTLSEISWYGRKRWGWSWWRTGTEYTSMEEDSNHQVVWKKVRKFLEGDVATELNSKIFRK